MPEDPTTGSGPVTGGYRWWCLAAGVGVGAAATVGPLHGAAESSLTAHMTQHVLLLGVASPLLALGVPTEIRIGHRWIGDRWMRDRCTGHRWPVALAAALAVHAGTTVAWHAPPLFDAAETAVPLHLAEHATFVATGVAFWWLAVAARRRTRAIGGFAAVFVNSLVSTGLGAWLALARAPVYTGGGPDALADQQLAGVVMWAFGGLASLVAAVVLFSAWLAAMERDAPDLAVRDAPDLAVRDAPDLAVRDHTARR